MAAAERGDAVASVVVAAAAVVAEMVAEEFRSEEPQHVVAPPDVRT